MNSMHTHRLGFDDEFLNLERDAFGSQQESGMVGYLTLPLHADPTDTSRARWRILLELTGTNRGLLPLEIMDDVIVGRDYQGSEAPDLDMTILKAQDLGVSRQHAMLRPTANHLYVIDLGSTNGTLVNGTPVGAGRAQPLNQGDHLTLGQLNMTVLLLEKLPGDVDGPDTDKLKRPSKRGGEAGGPPTDRLGSQGD